MIEPVKFWCQKILPLVYDDSLSYYEVLCKLISKLNDIIENENELTQELQELKNKIGGNNLKLLVQETLNDMYNNGTLASLIEETFDVIKNYTGAERGFNVLRVKDYVIQSGRFVKTVTTSPLIADENALGRITPKYKLNLDMPVIGAASVGFDSYNGYGVTVDVENNASIVYRGLFMTSNTEELLVAVNMQVSGAKANPPKTPKYNAHINGNTVVDIAKSYYRARVNGRKFAYGPNFVTYASSKRVNNSVGSALMECDTLVALVMLGLPYDVTPYANETPDLTAEFQNLPENPLGYSWVLPWRNNDTLGRKVTWTGGQNWWYWDNSAVFSDVSALANGDIVVFTKPTSKYFDGISHTGIIEVIRENGVDVPYLYHITGSGEVESPMMFEPLENVIKRGNYTTRDVYFARPNLE